MGQKLKREHLRCVNCVTNNDEGVLISVRNEVDEWSLMLCQKKVEKKLLSSGYAPANVGEAYEKFVKNFARFPVCNTGDTEYKIF